MAILEVKGLTKNFGKTEVLKGIDFSMERGEILSIIGSSGSGKTTLLRCLTSLESASGGEIIVDGQTVFDGVTQSTLTRAQKRNNQLKMGLVFQSFNLFPQYNVLDNVTLARRLAAKETPEWKTNRRQISEEIEQQARALIDSVGLSDKLQSYPCQLSGGQQQRVAIARALAAKPALLLADEPTGNLDSRTSQDVLGLLKITGEEFFQTIIMITHNEEIAQLADRILRIEDGHLTSGSSPRPEKDRHPDQMNFSLENDGFAAQHLPASRHPDLTTVSPESSDRR